jgi:hypothetical protein
MRKKNIVCFFLWAIALNAVVAGAANKVRLQLGTKLELGKNEFMFASIASVCEDPSGNLYVLDRMEHKVLKFSPEGKLTHTFGQKGQGPGDFQNPHLLAFTPKGRLVVADEMYNLTFLTEEGHFVERIHLDSLLAVGFVGEDRFYGWVWGQDHRSQVVVNSENDILRNFYQVPISAFSVSAPDESGRQVMFNYARDEFAPSLQFAHFGRYSAVGIGDKYDILILDGEGERTGHIRREIQPDRFSRNEKKYFEEDIESLVKERGWPRSVLRDLIKKIPDKKIFFNRVLMTDEHIFVFRIKNDITDESCPIPVDIFSLDGEFLGSAHIPDIPLHISPHYIYFVRSDEEENFFLEKASYQLIMDGAYD